MLLGLARGSTDLSFTIAYALSLSWDLVYLLTGINAAVSLKSKPVAFYLAQTALTVPLLLVRARCLEPLPNGDST